jgi:serine/threonine protein kinase
MALSTGTRLGPYEIISPLGAGGMGEVYRAQDTRLHRIVAIKVLPQHLAARVEARERFEREARAISSLNHPHICSLYDIGRQAEIDFLVMEYLEGETLARRLQKGALPQDQALRCAGQILHALDRAHRSGIVHRDLKPANVMLTRDGVKLLDFGLAKLREAATVPEQTVSMTLTTEGTIVGTLQYMAPEQLEGKDSDARTDIFAFGAVLYEMLTGRKAFSGTSQASLISSIMTAWPPPISSVHPMAPPALDRLLHRCLEKDPDERWQTTNDLAMS